MSETPNIQEGDFIQQVWYNVWLEVVSPWPDSKLCLVYRQDRGGPLGTETVLKDRIRRVHKKGDPWPLDRLRVVVCSDGRFGGKGSPPLPEKFIGTPPYKLEVWAWKLRQHAYSVNDIGPEPKHRQEQMAKLRLEDFLRAAEIAEGGYETYESAMIACRALEQYKDENGWRAICHPAEDR